MMQIFSSPSFHRRLRWLRDSQWSKTILYWALFLLVRHLLLNYLENLRDNLRSKLREDLVTLKRALMTEDVFKADSPFETWDSIAGENRRSPDEDYDDEGVELNDEEGESIDGGDADDLPMGVNLSASLIESFIRKLEKDAEPSQLPVDPLAAEAREQLVAGEPVRPQQVGMGMSVMADAAGNRGSGSSDSVAETEDRVGGADSDEASVDTEDLTETMQQLRNLMSQMMLKTLAGRGGLGGLAQGEDGEELLRSLMGGDESEAESGGVNEPTAGDEDDVMDDAAMEQMMSELLKILGGDEAGGDSGHGAINLEALLGDPTTGDATKNEAGHLDREPGGEGDGKQTGASNLQGTGEDKLEPIEGKIRPQESSEPMIEPPRATRDDEIWDEL